MADSAAPYVESDYQYNNAPHTMRYLMPAMNRYLPASLAGVRILDVGCGDGFVAGALQKRGATVVGVDLGTRAIEAARKFHPAVRFEEVAADENVLKNLDCPPFDIVVSTEVVEHVYDPRPYARGCYAALKPGGVFICSTPYHGWLKNVALTVTGKFDKHFDPLWDGGHIKFWSRGSLTRLLEETGFTQVEFTGAGRLPYLWMSMVLKAQRPA